MSVRLLSFCCLTVSLLVMGSSAFAGDTGAPLTDACGETTCPKGFVCEEGERLACAGAAAPPCDPADEKCVQQDSVPEETCDPTVIEECVPGPCKVDADCGEGMVCFESKSEECSGGGPVTCKEGAACPTPEPEKCTTTTTQVCVPRYVPPCKADSDCGDGFTCDDQSGDCSCGSISGTAGGAEPNTRAADGGVNAGDAAVPTDVACDCGEPAPDAEKRCQAEEIDCETVSDCPTGWSCEPRPSIGSSSCTFSKDAQPGDGGIATDGGYISCEQDTVFERPNRCAPPYADLFGGISASDSTGGGRDELAADGKGEPRAANGASADADAGVAIDKNDDGICSVARVHGASDAQSAGWLLSLGALGLVLAARRRARATR